MSVSLTKKAEALCFCFFILWTKVLVIFGPQAENIFQSVFPGGVYVGKNTLRVESAFLCASGVQKGAVRSEALFVGKAKMTLPTI